MPRPREASSRPSHSSTSASTQTKWTVKRPPLLIAARYGHSEVVALLLEAGADSTTEGPWGLNPLQHAQLHGHAETVALLRAWAKDPEDALTQFARRKPQFVLQQLHGALSTKPSDINIVALSNAIGLAESRGRDWSAWRRVES